MTLIHIEGFEGSGDTNTTLRDFVRKTYASSGPDTRVGTLAAGRVSGNSAFIQRYGFFMSKFTNKTTVTVGFGFKTNSWTNDNMIVIFGDEGTWQIVLETVTGGELKVLRNTTTLDTTSGLSCIANTWYYIELQATIHNSAGSFELRVDEVNVLNGTGIDTQESGSATLNNIAFYSDATTDRYYDDVYILDDAGAINNDFLGDMQVIGLYVDGDGTDSDFTSSGGANYEDVDDGYILDTTNYVESSTPTNKDMYTFEALGDYGEIAGVLLNVDALKTDAGDVTLNLFATFDAVDVEVPKAMTASWGAHQMLRETDPKSNVWTKTNLNATQFGFEID
ncbi:hypothetical protein LCGC14_1308590 [marine sediment metagenome]|uniref:Uncharacterized protein n=1 Tax=marine sediment metagenome TaxID=412755 RepID=A0A0F9N460_9ZZZZ